MGGCVLLELSVQGMTAFSAHLRLLVLLFLFFQSDNNATGILVAGNDHYVSDVIVYSALIGVELSGAANVISGVHTWNCATGKGGVGILNTAGHNHFTGCYLGVCVTR